MDLITQKDATQIQVFDGEQKIIFSETFNLINRKLTIKKLFDFDFIFEFHGNEKSPQVEKIILKGDDDNKVATFHFYEYLSPSGVFMKEPLVALNLPNGEEISVIVQIHSFRNDGNLLRATITMYSNKK